MKRRAPLPVMNCWLSLETSEVAPIFSRNNHYQKRSAYSLVRFARTLPPRFSAE